MKGKERQQNAIIPYFYFNDLCCPVLYEYCMFSKYQCCLTRAFAIGKDG